MSKDYIYKENFENGYFFKTKIHIGKPHASYRRFLRKKKRLEKNLNRIQDKLCVIYADLIKDSGL